MSIPIVFYEELIKRTKWTKEGYVYFVELQDDRKPVKIGFTTDLKNRWTDNGATDCPYEFRYIATFRGFMQHESILHALLKEHNIRGEWFNPVSPVLQYASDLNGLDLTEETLRLSSLFDKPLLVKSVVSNKVQYVRKPRGERLREAIKPFKRMCTP